MKLADLCLRYSIPLLKLNFSLLIALQVVKILLDTKDTKKTVLSCKIDDSFDVNTYELENFNIGKLNDDSRTVDDEKFNDLLNLKNANKIRIKDKSILISSASNFDLNQFRSNRTETISIFNEDPYNPNLDSTRTVFTTTSRINLTELLEFNNFRNLIKLAIILNLNLACLLTNLMLISYLITKKTKLYHRKFGRYFLMSHLYLVLSLIISIISINFIYILISNKFLLNTNKISFSSYVNDLLANYLKENSQRNNTMSHGTSKKSYVHYFIELDNVDLFSNNVDLFIANINIKINIIFMIISMCLMTAYAYLIQIELDIIKQLRNKEKLILKTDEKKVPDENNCNIGFISSDDEEEEDDYINYGDVEKLNLVKSDNGLVLEKFQKRKIEKKINSDFQVILHSVFVIYLLSIWDIVDVYQFFRLRNFNSINTFVTNANNNGQFGLINALNNDNNNFPTFKNLASKDDTQSLKLNFKNQEFYFKNKNQYYHHSIYQKNEERLEFDDKSNAMTKKSKTTIKIKVLLLLKTHSQYYSNLFIVFFTAIIIHNLDMIEYLINQNILQYLENRYEYI